MSDELTELAREFKNQSDSIKQKQGVIDAQLFDIEQKLARPRDDAYSYGATKSLGEQFIQSESLSNLIKAERGKASMSVKATLTLGSTSAGALAPAGRVDGSPMLPRRRITFREVLAQGQTNESSVEFVKQLTRTNAAATVAELGLKPEAALTFALANAPVRTIAVTLPASRQVLSDAPMLKSMIDAELLYMLADVEEAQLLNGDGVGSNVLGIVPQSTAFVAPFAIAMPTSIDLLLQGIAQLENADFEASYIVLNPLDWRRIQSLKDSTGQYLANGPFSADQIARLWSLPIVSTKAMQIDKFLIGDGKRGAQVFDRWQSRVEVSTEHSDFFVRNMVMLLAEERLALAVFHAGAHILGDFGLVA